LFGELDHVVEYGGDDVVVVGAHGHGARLPPAGVGAHVARAVLGSDVDQLGVERRPRVVHQVGARPARRGADLVPPRVDADDDVRVALPDVLDRGHDPADLLVDVDVVAGTRGHPADVDDVR